MAVNSKTRGAIRLVLTRMLEGPRARVFTATGGSTTTSVDGSIANGVFVDDHFNTYEIRNQTRGWTTYVTDFTRSTGTFTHTAQTASQSGDQIEVHSPSAWTVDQYNDAIDLAVQGAAHAKALAPKVSETLVYQATRRLYPIPSGFKYLARVSVDSREGYYARHRPGTVDTLMGLKATAGRTYMAQSFQIAGSNPAFQLGDLVLFMAKVGSPTGTVTITVHDDSSGAPAATVLATYTVSDVSTLPTEMTGQVLSPSARPLLATSTTYWLKITASYAVSASAYVALGEDLDIGYGDGSELASTDGSSWTARSSDIAFTLRSAQGYYSLLQGPHGGPDAHWRVVLGSTRYLEITQAGAEYLRDLDADGFVLRLEGQSYPTLPTADSDTIDLPYDYVVTKAGLYLAQMNPQWIASNNPVAAQMLPSWQTRTLEVEAGMLTWPEDGSVEVETL